MSQPTSQDLTQWHGLDFFTHTQSLLMGLSYP